VTKTPLISSDKGFEKIIEMDLVLLDFWRSFVSKRSTDAKSKT
jgi:hypothetical protein